MTVYMYVARDILTLVNLYDYCTLSNLNYIITEMVIYIVDTHMVDGSWGPWRLGRCSVTCDGGTLVRTRECNNPSPAIGGKDCVGPSSEVQPCNEGCCPGNNYVCTCVYV